MTQVRTKQVGCKSKIALIETQARYLQLELWNRRHELWLGNVPIDPVDVVEPGVALNHLGYEIETVGSLGLFNELGVTSEVAGMVDHQHRLVKVSARYQQVVQRFTAAHELGHVVLHPNSQAVFRDLPNDGPTFQRDFREREADQFALFFLMPGKQVAKFFLRNFLTTRFVLSDDTAFALGGKSIDAIWQKHPTRRDLSGLLASANSYNGQSIRSLTSVFGVSRTSMAIRLEELGLV